MNYGNEPNISFFHTFGCKCYVLNNDKDILRKFDLKSDETIFLGYSTPSKTFLIFNKQNLVIEEFVYCI